MADGRAVYATRPVLLVFPRELVAFSRQFNSAFYYLQENLTEGLDPVLSDCDTCLSTFVQAGYRVLEYPIRTTGNENTETIIPLVETGISDSLSDCNPLFGVHPEI